MDGHEAKIGGSSTPFMGRLNLDPDPNALGGGVTTEDTSAAPTPATTATNDDLGGSVTTDDTPNTEIATRTPADPNQAAGVTRTEPQANDWQSIRDAARTTA